MSFTQSLVARSIQMSIASTPVNHDDRTMLLDSIASFEALIDGYQRVSGAMESVEHLTRQCLASPNITAEQAALFEFSTEAIFKAAGVELPRELMFVSFEKASDYSFEADSKIASTLKRVGEWLMDLLKRIGESLRGVITRFRGSISAGKAKLVKLRDKLRDKSDDSTKKKDDKKGDVSTEASDNTVEVPDIKILGGPQVKVETTINKAQENTRKAGVDILNIVRAVSEAAKRFSPDKHSDKAGLDNYINDLMLSAGMEKGDAGGKREFPIVNGTGAQLTFAKKSDATVTARAGAIPYEKKPGSMPRLTKEDRLRLLDFMIEAYDKIESITKPMDTAAGIFTTMSGAMNSGYRSALAKISAAKDDREMESYSRLSRVYSTLGQVMHAMANLPSTVFRNYMAVQWAADNYVNEPSKD